MSLIYTLLIAATDMVGIIFNIRMLRRCFKEKSLRYTFLQKCRTLAICQCACQVVILVADAAESWKGLEAESRLSCNVFSALSSSMLVFQGSNLMAISIVYFDQPTGHEASELRSKLKISAALSLGFTGSAVIWYNGCFFQEFLFEMALRVFFVVSVAFVLLLFAWNTKNSIHVQLEDDSQKASMETCSLLWKVLQEHRRPVLLITLLIVCLVVILSWSPRLAGNEALKGVLYSFITRFVVGIFLPVTLTDLIELSKEDDRRIESCGPSLVSFGLNLEIGTTISLN